MKQLWSVTRFEFLTYAKNKTFLGVTLFLMVLALLAPAVPVIIDMIGNVTAERTIAIVDNTGWFTPETVGDFISPRATFFTDTNAAVAAVESGEHNYAIVLNEYGFTLHVTTMGMGVANLQGQATHLINHHRRLESLAVLGVDADQVAEIFAFHPMATVVTIGDDYADADAFFENIIYAYVMIVVLMLGLQMGGAHLLTSVVREKSTKTMELLVTSCAPSKMLNGKVIGVGAALLSQILVMMVSIFISMRVTAAIAGDTEDIFTVAISPAILGFVVLFFLLGFIAYAYFFAALASTASRQEDAMSMGQIPQLLLAAGAIAAFATMTNPGAVWVGPLSHVPFFAPFVMFVRITMDAAPAWEIAVSVAAQIVTIGIVSWMAAKIYRMGTLMYGAKPTFKNILQAFK